MAKIIKLLVLSSAFLQITSAITIGNWLQTRVDPVVLEPATQLNLYARILGRYDIIALPSLEDATELYNVMIVLKQFNSNYELHLSARMNKPSIPFIEHFAFIYSKVYDRLNTESATWLLQIKEDRNPESLKERKDVVSLSTFMRDQPTGAFCAEVRVLLSNQTFVMAIVHLASSDLINELELLPGTAERLKNTYKIEDILFVGDFNTVEGFTSLALYNNVSVNKDSRFKWYIDWGQNTFSNDLAYGAAARFLAFNDIQNWILEDSTRIWNTTEYFNLTFDETIGMTVFYPVELEMLEPILRP